MTKKELVDAVSSKAEITKAEANKVVNAVFDAVYEGIAKDGKVVLPGFGTFEVRSRTARVGRNPRTGEQIKIKAKKVVKLVACKALKDAILG